MGKFRRCPPQSQIDPHSWPGLSGATWAANAVLQAWRQADAEAEPLLPFRKRAATLTPEEEGSWVTTEEDITVKTEEEFDTPDEGEEDDDMGGAGKRRRTSRSPKRRVVFDQRKPNWFTERYQLQRRWFRTVVNNLGGQIPDTELFGDRKMHLLQNWMGPGSPRPDSFQQSWKYSKVGMVYGNPPYSRISAVLQKFRSDKAYGILILPRWTNKSWHRMAMGMALKKFVIRGHESIFEDEYGRPFPG